MKQRLLGTEAWDEAFYKPRRDRVTPGDIRWEGSITEWQYRICQLILYKWETRRLCLTLEGRATGEFSR